MPSLTIRFAHYSSQTPILELEVQPTASIAQLRSMLEDRLISDDICLLRMYTRWFCEVNIGSRKRLVELASGDENEPIAAVGIEDESIVYLDGPITDSMDGVGKAVALLSVQMKNTAKDSAVVTLLHQLVTATLMRDVKSDEKEARAELFAMEESTRTRLENVRKETSFGKAVMAMAKHPGKPLDALWEVLNDPSHYQGTAVAMAIVASNECGLECKRVRGSDELRSKSGFAIGVGATPLLHAINANRLDVVKALVAAKANMRAKDVTGDTALIVAAGNGFTPIISYLISIGLPVSEASDDGFTPLHHAANRDHVEAMETLVAKGADLKAVTRSGLLRSSKTPYQMLDEDTCPEYKRMLALLTPK